MLISRAILLQQGHCLLDAGELLQTRLDLAHFDPVAAPLHLEILPACIHEPSIGQDPHQVPRPAVRQIGCPT